MKFWVAILLASVAALAAGAASASILFDDGPISASANGAFSVDGPIDNGQSIYDTFTATGSGQLGVLTFGIWVPTGETPTSLTWWLGPSAFNSSIGGGTASLTPANYVLKASDVFGSDVYEVTLTGLTSAMINTGSTYVLTLGDVTDSGGDASVGWDNNGGPAACGFFFDGVDLGACTSEPGGQAFTMSTAPEPATWVLMLAGFAGLGAARRSRRSRCGSSAPA